MAIGSYDDFKALLLHRQSTQLSVADRERVILIATDIAAGELAIAGEKRAATPAEEQRLSRLVFDLTSIFGAVIERTMRDGRRQ